MNNFRNCLLLVSLLLLDNSSGITQPYNFKYLGIEQGLSNNSVRSIYQDGNGFMWFGTYDGLNRYDGYQFRIFRNKLDDTSSLPHNYIYAINEDQQHHLWVGTGQGAVVYNSLTTSFSPVYYRSAVDGQRQKLKINTTDIQPDSLGNVLIGTNGLGLLIQTGEADAVQIPYQDGRQKITDYYVTSILIHEGQTWLLINSVGLCRYDYSTKKIVPVNTTFKASSGMVASGNHIWIGTSAGLYLFNKATQQIEKHYTDTKDELSSDKVASLYLDKKQQLWIGTEGGGVDVLDINTGHFEYLLPVQGEPSLSSESAFSIFEDREGRKWIGTLKGGVDIIDPQQSPFRTFVHRPLNTNSLVNDFVSCFYEDTIGNIFIGTDGGGMSIWNRRENQFTNYVHQPGQTGSLSNNLVSSIRQDYLGNTWIATFGGGVNRFNKTTGHFQRYHCINPITGNENANAWIIYEDRGKTLWVTTFSNGQLYRYNRTADKFEMFAPQAFDLVSFMEDAGGNLWGGNSHQLFNINRITGGVKIYEIGKPVRAIYEDSRKRFWLGTEGGGLVLFNREKGRIEKRYSDADGLSNNQVLTILEDNKNNLWLGTFGGLSKFNVADGTFKNFFGSDGLQSNQFSYNAALRLRSGEMVFGGIKGFSLFQPDSLQFRTSGPNLQLTGIRVDNEPISSHATFIKQSDAGRITAIEVPYDKAALFFDFSAMEYSVPGKIQYAYFLEGWDKTWNNTGRLRTASYTRLKEGTYTLHLRATNNLGDWSGEQKVLTITVLPPWYRSWWAYLIYLGIIAWLIYLYNGYRVRQSKLEYDVKLANMETEKEKELNEKKLAFFTDVSHEFRTPLTLIINPLKDFLSNNRKAEPGELNIVYRNASRLLRLVNQLLQFQKAGSGADELKVSQIDFCALGKEVYESFELLAQRKGIDFRFECAAGPDSMYADAEKIEIVLFNLLSNAIKYTPDGGRIVFSVKENGDEILATIADTGPGIPEGIGEKLFERFYQVNESKSLSKPGFGIGLYLVKHFMELHKGHISYGSRPGGGTVFTLRLLKGTAHFGPDIIIHQNETPAPVEPETIVKGMPILTAAMSMEKQEPEELITGKKSILIVEDDADIGQYIKSIFKDNYIVYEAGNGETGIKLAQTNLPDIIISDIMMSNGTGIDLCNALKKDAALSHIPIILLTAVSASDMKLKGLECGADDYITKPFEKDLLVARVTNLLNKRTTLQNYFYNEVTLQKNTLKVSAEYKHFVERCIAIVEAHLEDDQFSIKMLAREIGMSHSNLYKKVKSVSGQSVNAFIRFIRLRKAAELFINTNMNVNETAFEVGINDIKYFREQFNKLFGMNPSEYIKKYRKAFSNTYRVNKEVFGEDEGKTI